MSRDQMSVSRSPLDPADVAKWCEEEKALRALA